MGYLTPLPLYLVLTSNQTDLCCYSLEQYEKIAKVIRELPWEPFNVTFNGGTICNYGIEEERLLHPSDLKLISYPILHSYLISL